VRALGIDAEVSAHRVEELALERAQEFAVAVARALAPLPSLVELAAPLLAPEGLLIAMKGRPSDDEVDRGDRVAAKVGLERIGTDAVELPGRNEHRTLITYRRIAKASVRLPRRPGMAQKHPMA